MTSLCWDFHEPFVRYVESLTDGEITAADGAQILADGSFRFLATEGSSRRFCGSISFTGHHGMMAVRLVSPFIDHLDKAMAVLHVDDPFAPGEPLPLAELRPAASVGHDRAYTARLLEEGTDLFLGTYSAGMELAPLILTRTTNRSTAMEALR